MTDLAARSVRLIRDSQAPTGAYPAAPTYPTYRYCWFRDGAFIAHAMDVAGQAGSARQFHDWVAGTLNRRADLVERAITRRRDGQPLQPDDVLHTRYTLEGDEAPVEWPNFQLDGLGTWLWALARHQALTDGPLAAPWKDAAELAAAYLAALWDHPCYDLWEEFPDKLHTYTLAAVHGGLAAHQELAGADRERTLAAIEARIRDACIRDGHFTKYIGTAEVDASLIGLSTPYGVVPPDHPALVATVERIRASLWRPQGGVHRYATDSFYGGGGWVVLAAWLGWYYSDAGDDGLARTLLAWVEQQADGDGALPEQVSDHLIHPEALARWTDLWGPVARPLLWSHANYLLLRERLQPVPGHR